MKNAPSYSAHKFALEYDGSLVCDNVVVVSPSEDFPKSALAQIVEEHARTHAPLTVEAVEQFFIDKLNEMQATIPEYAQLQFTVHRHIFSGELEPPHLRWQGYFSSGSFFPTASVMDAHVKLSEVMEHVAQLATGRDPVNIAKTLREQAARLLMQADQVEKNEAAAAKGVQS